jgi:hypothetical protein
MELRPRPVAGFQAMFGYDGRMIRVHAFLSELDTNVITEPLRVRHLEIAAFGKIAGTAVDNSGVEGDAVSRLHVPAYNVIVIAVVLDVGQRERVVIAEFNLIAFITRQRAKIGLPEVLPPSMRAANELERTRFFHWRRMSIQPWSNAPGKKTTPSRPKSAMSLLVTITRPLADTKAQMLTTFR